MDKEELDYLTDVIGEALDVKGFAKVSSYMFGDEIIHGCDLFAK